MAKIVWPPIVANEFGLFEKCCEKNCEDMDPVDPCKCDCECPDIAVTGTPICIYEKEYQMWTHPSGCITNWYEYTGSATYETYDEAECTWPSLEFKFTAEQEAEIQKAQAEVDRLKAKVENLKNQVQQKPDSFGLPLALANAEDELAQAEAELASKSSSSLKFWFHGEQIGGQGCDGYKGQYFKPDTGEEGVYVKVYDPFATPEPHWPSAWLPNEGIEIYPGSGKYYYGTKTPRPTGDDCICESKSPCPPREPRYDVDLDGSGTIDSNETDLCATDPDDPNTTYYECDPQPDCSGCTDPEKSNYDPNANVDDGFCCDEPCYQRESEDPCVYFSGFIDVEQCCCTENYKLPEFWFGEEPSDISTKCYLEDEGEVCYPPEEEEEE